MSINKARLLEVVNRSSTRCYFWEGTDLVAVPKQKFRDEVFKRSSYDLECTLTFVGHDIQLNQLDQVNWQLVSNPTKAREALRIFVAAILAEYGLERPRQLDMVDSLWVDVGTLMLEGWTRHNADAIIQELMSAKALGKLLPESRTIYMQKAAYRTMEREWS
jgi:hypothetical protein